MDYTVALGLSLRRRLLLEVHNIIIFSGSLMFRQSVRNKLNIILILSLVSVVVVVVGA